MPVHPTQLYEAIGLGLLGLMSGMDRAILAGQNK
jgi:prolipoprotein diacylglyceryltransferase